MTHATTPWPVAAAGGLIPRQRTTIDRAPDIDINIAVERAAAAPVIALPVPDTRTPAPSRTRRVAGHAALDVVATLTLGALVTWSLGMSVAVAAMCGLAWLVSLVTTRHYRRHALGVRSATAIRPVVTALLRSGGASAVVIAVVRPALPFATVGVLLVVLASGSAVIALATTARTRSRIVLVGHPRDVRAKMAELHAAGRHRVVAVCLTRHSAAGFGEVPSYTGTSHLHDSITAHDADAVVAIPSRHLTSSGIRRLEWATAGAGASMYVDTALLDVRPSRTEVVSGHGIDAVHLAPAVLSGPQQLLKGLMDRTFAWLLLIALAPVLAVIAFLVRRDSPGPALFRQERVGHDGETFEMLKFRSMTVDAENERTALVACNEADGVLFKMQHDPRVTSLGRLLRRYSLDELPQLWNVVRGEMSLVGPRPALPSEVAAYDVDPRRRLAVKPGLTGLWQVSGRSDLSWDESVRLDVKYVDNWSLGGDLAILARTLQAVVGHRGAY